MNELIPPRKSFDNNDNIPPRESCSRCGVIRRSARLHCWQCGHEFDSMFVKNLKPSDDIYDSTVAKPYSDDWPDHATL